MEELGSFGKYNPRVALRILSILGKHGVKHQERKNFIYVACPFHNSESGSLNFAIHKSGLFARCWSCGKKANWNEYAEKSSLPVIKSLRRQSRSGRGNDGYSMDYLNHLLEEVARIDLLDGHPFELPKGMKLWNKPWRKLRADFLSNLPAFEWFDDVSDYYRILFPITLNNEVVGYTAGRAKRYREYPSNDPKYRSSQGLPIKETLFMLDQVDAPVLAITEGAYDTLRLVQNGIPAVGNIAAKSVWSKEKVDYILSKPGLKHVVLAFDNDRAGQEVSEVAKNDLSNDIEISEISLPENEKDVGDAPLWWIRKLKQDIMRESGWDGQMALKPIVVAEGGS